MGGSRKRNKAKAKKLRVSVRRERSRTTHKRTKRFLNWSIVLAVLALVASLPSALSVLNTKVVISPYGKFDTTQPFDFQFQLANESSFAIYDIEAVGNVDAVISVFRADHIVIGFRPRLIIEIEPGSKPITFSGHVVTQTIAPIVPSDSVDTTIAVSFRASFTWWRKTISRRFMAQRTSSGTMEWTEIPVK
jgi:hypothetical protein